MNTSAFAFCTAILLLVSCHSSKEDKTPRPKKTTPKIDFNTGSTIPDFSAQTIWGKRFDSKSCKGKYWVVFFYNKSALKSAVRFSSLLNQASRQFKNKMNFLGIMNGFVERENEVLPLLKSAAFNFPQIDNSISYERESKIDDNVFCTPASIIIDPAGKVIDHTCGDIEPRDIKRKLAILLNEKF